MGKQVNFGQMELYNWAFFYSFLALQIVLLVHDILNTMYFQHSFGFNVDYSSLFSQTKRLNRALDLFPEQKY